MNKTSAYCNSSDSISFDGGEVVLAEKHLLRRAADAENPQACDLCRDIYQGIY